MATDNVTLYYIHDPMCSWCWGFKPVWQQLQQTLSSRIEVTYLVGGLASDTDQPMPMGMQQSLAATWQRIQQHIPGTQFNYEFWNPSSNTQPRRATYPACRAVLAAKLQQPSSEHAMIEAIQQAYYLQAKNPVNLEVLIEVAASIGLDPEQFAHDMASPLIEDKLQHQLQQSRRLSSQGFPSLMLQQGNTHHAIALDYNNSHTMQQSIDAIIHPQQQRQP
jgi:putative protein-disulfide isomerase